MKQIYLNLDRRLIILNDEFLGKPNGWADCWRLDKELSFKSKADFNYDTIKDLLKKMKETVTKGWIYIEFKNIQPSITEAAKAIMDDRATAVKEGRSPKTKLVL